VVVVVVVVVVVCPMLCSLVMSHPQDRGQPRAQWVPAATQGRRGVQGPHLPLETVWRAVVVAVHLEDAGVELPRHIREVGLAAAAMVRSRKAAFVCVACISKRPTCAACTHTARTIAVRGMHAHGMAAQWQPCTHTHMHIAQGPQTSLQAHTKTPTPTHTCNARSPQQQHQIPSAQLRRPRCCCWCSHQAAAPPRPPSPPPQGTTAHALLHCCCCCCCCCCSPGVAPSWALGPPIHYCLQCCCCCRCCRCCRCCWCCARLLPLQAQEVGQHLCGRRVGRHQAELRGGWRAPRAC